MTHRRAVLKGAAGALAGLAWLPRTRTAFAAERPAVIPVVEDLVMLGGAGGNILVRPTSAGHVLVDSGAAEFSEAVIDAVAALGGDRRVGALFNTHWHLDQVGSNETFGSAGATIIAHEKTRLHLATDYYLPSEDRYQRALPEPARPTETFYTTGSTTLGDEHIEYGYLLEAHTDGDIYVYFRDSNVLAVGDAVSPERDPALDWFGGGWLGGRVDALKLLLDLADDETKVVPSYGAVVTRAEVQMEYDMMLLLFERMVELVRKGDSAEDILAQGVMADLGRAFNDPLKFLYDAHKGMWAHHNTLSPDVV